jgi:hypothetical protein
MYVSSLFSYKSGCTELKFIAEESEAGTILS